MKELKIQKIHCLRRVKCRIKGGFTLIELMVVIVLFALIGFLGIGLFSSVLRGSSKATVINKMKQNGSYAVGIMERFIRNAEKVTDDTEPCVSGSGNSISLLNPDGGTTTFELSPEGRIASYSSVLDTTVYLTSADISVQPGGSLFTCSRIEGRPDRIAINFTVSEKAAAGVTLPSEKKASVSFQTSVSLRNY